MNEKHPPALLQVLTSDCEVFAEIIWRADWKFMLGKEPPVLWEENFNETDKARCRAIAEAVLRSQVGGGLLLPAGEAVEVVQNWPEPVGERKALCVALQMLAAPKIRRKT